LKGELYAKLIEMGLYKGKQVKVLFKAPFGDPIAIDIEGYVLSLRKDEADQVQIES
jgi:Fe2+ transport system protein FeoA